jgi:hypothetical protein
MSEKGNIYEDYEEFDDHDSENSSNSDNENSSDNSSSADEGDSSSDDSTTDHIARHNKGNSRNNSSRNNATRSAGHSRSNSILHAAPDTHVSDIDNIEEKKEPTNVQPEVPPQEEKKNKNKKLDIEKDPDILFALNGGIKVYNGNTIETRTNYLRSIYLLNSVAAPVSKITKPQSSTLTAEGRFAGIRFNEVTLFPQLTKPTGYIQMIGCNFGEMFNDDYKPPVINKKSSRGRKPKPKVKNKRKQHGNGKYFESQITFIIKHPETHLIYKIKLFRNGTFQVPGIKRADMQDLLAPINILREYITGILKKDIAIMYFKSVMRNYKSRITDENMRVDLEQLEEIIDCYKSPRLFDPFLNAMLAPLLPNMRATALKFVGKTNPLNIAEVGYTTDKFFCLNVKLYRPIPEKIKKKTTLKLLKKGKINFDGSNSELEMLELHQWLSYIYNTYDDICVDVSNIKNDFNREKLAKFTIADCIFDED